jgi:hypothetical protein
MVDAAEALGWVGYRIDDVYGARVGVVEDIYVDHESGVPCWMLARMGRFSESYGLVPVTDAVAVPGHVWVPYEKDLIRRAPQVARGIPLVQALEASLCTHYGVMSSRGAEIAELPRTVVSALSAESEPSAGGLPEPRESGDQA